jgi:hypothetical protein
MMRNRISHCGLAAIVLCGFAAQSFAASIVCTKGSAKCYFFQSMECQDLYLNPGDACMRTKNAGFFHVRGLKIDSRVLARAQSALRQAKIEFFTAKATERGRLVLMVDDLAIPAATKALNQAGITSLVELIPQGPLR